MSAGEPQPAHARLTELFAEAIALAEDERAAWLEALRRDEPALADELASLLAADARAALATGGLALTADERPGARDRARLVVPGYQVRGVLGEGGMGTVYEADQLEPARRVAIKVLHARSASALARFKTEAQIMARLDHPGIARVLEAGDADGHPFLVMEHVPGETLDVHARSRSRAQRLGLFLQICDAVHHAHVKGVIHRDLKPTNVMVRDGDRAVILDFGVARLAADDGSTPGGTRAGELIGTPLYMSPEQARLRPDEVDARSDVYTLGVILYELLADRLPYRVEGLPLPAITVVVCEDPPVPLGKVDPSLAGDLEAITLVALAKEPRDRYQSVAALADDVRRFVEGRPVSVHTPGALERARRFVRRRPLVAAGLAAGAAAVVAFGVVVTVLWLDARAARRVAETARARAETASVALEGRGNQLVLRQARAALARDPTAALAWLATLTPRDVDAGTAWSIADEAVARGVAAHVLRGHTDEVHWIEPVAGGGFVTGGYDGRAILWEGAALAPRVLITARQGRIHLVRPAPDGQRFAVGADDGELYVVGRDGAATPLPGHTGDVQHLAWSADGRYLVTGDDTGRVWAWERGLPPGRALPADASAVGALAFAGQGAEVVLTDHAGTIRIVDLAADAAVIATTSIGADVEAAALSGDRLIVIDVEGVVRTWRRDGGRLVAEHVVATQQKLKRAEIGPGGAWVALGGVSGQVTRVDLGPAAPRVEALGAHRAQVRSLAISSDGRWIADGGEDGSLDLRDLSRGRTIALRGHAGRIRHLAFLDGLLLSGDSDGVVRVWRLAALTPALLDARGAPVIQLAIADDGATLAAIDADGEVSRWSLVDGRHQPLGRVAGRGTEIAIAGDLVITGTAEGEVTWWTAPAPVRRVLPGMVRSLVASRDRIAVALSTGPIAVFALDGTPVATLPGHPGGTDVLAFDPDETLLASGGQDRAIRIWRRDGDGFAAAPPLEGGIRGDTHFLAFTPRGDRLIAGGNDGAVLAWDVRAGGVERASERVLVRHTGALTALATSPDGRWLASAGRDATVSRVELATGQATTVALPAAVITIAIGAGGELHAVSRTGAVMRWDRDPAVVEVEHGVRLGRQLGPARWVLAFEDGSLLVAPLGRRTLGALREFLAAATTVRLGATGDDLVTPSPSRR